MNEFIDGDRIHDCLNCTSWNPTGITGGDLIFGLLNVGFILFICCFTYLFFRKMWRESEAYRKAMKEESKRHKLAVLEIKNDFWQAQFLKKKNLFWRW